MGEARWAKGAEGGRVRDREGRGSKKGPPLNLKALRIIDAGIATRTLDLKEPRRPFLIFGTFAASFAASILTCTYAHRLDRRFTASPRVHVRQHDPGITDPSAKEEQWK